MKLFKNKVGRPSNETKSMRRIFVVSIVAIIISVIAILVSLLTKTGVLTKNLQGASGKYKIYYSVRSNKKGIAGLKLNYEKTLEDYHNGSFTIPKITSNDINVSSGYSCTFKGWIVQRRKDGYYRVWDTKNKNYTWQRYQSTQYPYANFIYGSKNKLGETVKTFSVSDNVTLYADFDCSKGNSSSSNSSGKYKVTFAKHSSCNGITIRNSETSYTNTYKIPSANITYGNSGLKFKYWIIQRTSDGRYRVYNKDTKKYVWYNENKDKKINWSYATFTPGETTSAYKAPIKLYAVCGTGGSSSGSNSSSSTSSAVSKDKIRIVYQKNAGAATGTMATKDFNVNSSINLDKNKYKLDGHNFEGWKAYKIIDGVKKYYKLGWTQTNYKNASIIKDGVNLKKEITNSDGLKGGDTIYLQANWVELKGQDGYYTIVFKSNGGSGSMPNQKIEQASGNWGSTNLKGNTFTRTGYKFDDWKAYRIINGSKKYFVVEKGWVGTSSSNATTIGNKVDIQKNYSKDSIYKTYDIDKYTSSGKYIYLEAQWKIDDSKRIIQIDKNGGTLKSGKRDSFVLSKYDTITYCSDYLSRSGYTCTGWKIYRKDMNDGRKTYYTSSGWKTVSSQANVYKTIVISQLPSYGNESYAVTLYLEPQWKQNSTTTGTPKWTINIDRNGGTKISGSSDSISSSSQHTLPGCSYYASKDGYTCTGWKLYRKDVNGGRSTFFTMSPKKGWHTTVSGNGYVFNNYYLLSNIKDFIGDGKTFYAQIQWKKKGTVTTAVRTWTVIIKKGEGSFKKNNHNTTKTSVLTIKSNGTLPSCINYLERTGYTCTGWKLYRDTRQGTKYFVSGKGWTGNYQQGFKFSNNSKISSIYDFTGNGATIYIKPIWFKK